MAEAEFARETGYDIGLLSLAALPTASDARTARALPHRGARDPGVRLLSAALGGRPAALVRILARLLRDRGRGRRSRSRRSIAIRRSTSCAAWSTAGAPARSRSTPGNDDNIIPDLLAEFRVGGGSANFRGGLLGQWAVWTRRAVELLARIHCCREADGAGAAEILAESAALTDANAALFDVRNRFAGCIAGLHEILRRQGLLEGRWCLDPAEDLSPGQMEEIDRVAAAYPHLTDDDFVRSRVDGWLN